jgi:hypothetical protein
MIKNWFKSTNWLLIFFFAFGMTTASAAVAPLCASLFLSQPETNMIFSSAIYSPMMPTSRGLYLADNHVLRTFRDFSDDSQTRGYLLSLNAHLPGTPGYTYTPEYLMQMELNNIYRGFAQGLDGFTNGFGARATPEEIENIRSADRRLFGHLINSQRLGYAILNRSDRTSAEPFSAFIRVYDGTDYSWFKEPNGVKMQSSFYLPTEISMKKNNVKTDFFDGYRRKGYQIFQIGKYVLSKKLNPEERKFARREILKWLRENYLDPSKMISEKVVFIINVDSLAHAVTYKKAFGTSTVDPHLFEPPIESPNSILFVELQTLRERLEFLIEDEN